MMDTKFSFCSLLRSFFMGLSVLLGAGLGIFLLFFFALSLLFLAQKNSLHPQYQIIEEVRADKASLPQEKDLPCILRIHLKGIIGSPSLSLHSVKNELEGAFIKSHYRGKIRAILLSIDSPGGSGFESDKIYRLLKEYKESYQIPIYAYVDGLCASGGLYIAAIADQIFCSDLSLVGSVGVLSHHFNLSQSLEKLGIQSMTLTEGENKDALSLFREWKEGEEEMYTHIMQFFYNRFLSILEENRPQLSRQLLSEKYGARIFPSFQAREAGFVDEIVSSIHDAEHLLARRADMEENQYFIIEKKEKWHCSLPLQESHGAVEKRISSLLKRWLSPLIEEKKEAQIPSDFLPCYLYEKREIDF